MRVLIIKPSSLGDIICSLPVAQSIRDQVPGAEISWVVKSRFADIVRRCPTVNGEVLEFEHVAGWRGAGDRQGHASAATASVRRSPGLSGAAAFWSDDVGCKIATEGGHC